MVRAYYFHTRNDIRTKYVTSYVTRACEREVTYIRT